MTQLKRRLAILLSFIMVFTTVFVAAPMEAQAKTTTTYYFSGPATYGDSYTIKTYKGASNFYAGDYATCYTWSYTDTTEGSTYKNLGYLSSLSGVSYSSSKKSVATIDSKTGLVKLKGTGTTTISMKYKGNTIKFKLNVITKTKFFNELKEKAPYSDYKTLATTYDKAAKAFLKKVGTNPNVKKDKNRFDILETYNTYTNYSSGYTQQMDKYDPETGTYKYNFYFYAPTAAHAYAVRSKISSDIDSINPFSTNSAKHFEATKITGKAGSNKITVTLKTKVDDTMLLGANAAFSWDSEITKSDTYTFPIVVKNTSNGRQYYAIATVKKGSKTMTIELKNHKLAKNKTYELLNKTKTGRYSSYLGNWLSWGKSTFKAK